MITTKVLEAARPHGSLRVGIGAPGGAARPEKGAFARSRAVVEFTDPAALVAALAAGHIQGAVRGRLPPAPVLALLRRKRGKPLGGRAVLLEPKRRQGVLFGPVGVTEGRGAAARVRFAAFAAAALRDNNLSTEDPLIAVLSVGRAEDASRGRHVARSLEEGAKVVSLLQRKGLDAFHAGAQVEDVLGDADIVVAPDGASGNLAFRALHLTAGMRSFGALVLGSPFPFVDTSRRRTSYEDPLRLASYLARKGAGP